MQFVDRVDAGKQLAARLAKYRGKSVVYALPRGGVVIGAEIARELEVPLGLILVRKIGHPNYSEYAIGAVAEGGEPIFNESEKASIDESWLKSAVQRERLANENRRQKYFPEGYRQPAVKDMENKVAIIVDDGIATGLTAKAAVLAAKKQAPKKVIVAVPVAPQDSVEALQEIADEVLVLDSPANFKGSVGSHYQNFPQVEDEEVVAMFSSIELRM